MTDPDVDVLVVGGGPVGLAAALLARREGLSATVVERRPGAVDKACGEGLMPSAVAALEDLAVTPPGRPFRGIRYVDATSGRYAEARFAGSPGLGVRRTVLHAALSAAADAAGVQRVAGAVGEVRQGPFEVSAAGMRARWLFAADGLHSGVRRQLGLHERAHGGPARYGLRRHFAVAPWSDLVEVHWADEAEAYVTPVSDAEVGVAVLTGRRGVPYDAWLLRFPAIADRLGGAVPVTEVLGAGPLEQSAGRRVLGRVLLVGDAAGYVDALTGEGIAVGLAQARAAVGCVASGRPEEYERAWRTVTRRSRALTLAVRYAARHQGLRGVVVPAAEAVPAAFGVVVRALA